MTPSKMQVVGFAYRDVFRAFRAMPRTVLIAFLVCIVHYILVMALTPTGIGEVFDGLMEFALGVATAFFMTPFLIAVHRFILLDERPTGYVLDFHSPRFMRFFGFSVLVSALLEIPGTMWLADVGSVASIGALIVVTFVSLHLTLIFPAIAIDAPGANPNNAASDARGRLWFILLTGLLAVLPLLLILVPGLVVDVSLRLSMPAAGSEPPSLLLLLVFLNAVPVQAVLVAVASHLYRSFADRLKSGPGVVTA